MDTERKIEAVMTSLDRLSQVEPAPGFYDRVKNRLEHATPGVVSGAWLMRIAAAVLLLIGVNIAVLLSQGGNEDAGRGRMEKVSAFAAEFGLAENTQSYY